MFESRMSSRRHYNDHYDAYDRSYSNGSAYPTRRRRTYPRPDVVKINPLLKNSAKYRAKMKAQSGSSRKANNQWVEKRAEHEEYQKDIRSLKNRKDALNAEDIEAELSTFKKGTFVFDAKAEAPKRESVKSLEKGSGSNGHSKFLLKRTNSKKHRHLSSAERQHPRISSKAARSARNGYKPRDDDSKQEPTEKAVDLPPRERPLGNKKATRSKRTEKQRVHTIVTVSPSRVSRNGGFVQPAVPDYFYGPGYGPSAAHYYQGGGRPLSPYYGQPPAGAMATSSGGSVPGYYAYPDPSGAMDYYYGNTTGDGGAWYPNNPYSEATRPPLAAEARTRGDYSANLDLTAPDDADTPMSPGRRVNKIQKQLEYYFSADNLSQDKYLREVMDGSGWVHIDTLLEFQRMKTLGATKELVTEAAFHSTTIEIDPKNTDRIRRDKLWKQYVGKTKSSPPSRKRSAESKARERERALQRELDNAPISEETIAAIVDAIEKKQERRERRRRERERAKAKRAESKRRDQGDGDDDDDAAGRNSAGGDGDDDREPPLKALIIEDQQKGDEDRGDPDGNDMVNID